MSNDKWSEQKIEQLLSQVPKLNDTRSKEQVLNRLKEEKSTKGQTSTKKRRYWAPPAVAVAALITLTLLTASLLNQSNSSNESTASQAMDMEAAKSTATEEIEFTNDSNDPSSKKVAGEGEEEEAAGESARYNLTSLPSGSSGTAVYSTDLSDDVTIFRVGLIGEAANSVPVTFLIPKTQIVEDFGDKNPTSLELYQMYAPLLDEEGLGFSEYHPYKGSFSTEGTTLIHTLPKDHDYDMASGTITVYKQSLKETFQDYNQIVFRNEDGSPVVFDQVGEPSKPMNLKDGGYNYYLYSQSNGSVYLTPNFGQSYSSLPEALLQMKESDNDLYTSVIPQEITFEVKNEKGITHVIFNKAVDLEQMDSTTAMNMIEGLLLTGASFGQPLQFENVVQENWSNFDFTQPLPIPIGSNKMSFMPLINE